MPEPVVITPSLFYQYATCPSWIWNDHFGDPKKKGEMPELAQKLLEQGIVHEEAFVASFTQVTRVQKNKGESDVSATLRLMQEGAAMIYQGTIEATVDGVLHRGRPDLLERVEGKSLFGAWMYIPVDIKSARSVRDTHKLQLAFYGRMLEVVQGVRPALGAIINADKARLPVELSSALYTKTARRVDQIKQILSGEHPPMKLTSKCKHSPWFSECIRLAEEADDIALLYNLHEKTDEALRGAGIRTVHQAAKMDVVSFPPAPYATEETLTRIKLQATALVEDRLIWLGVPELPEAPLKIYFDIEGDPLLHVQYLFGCFVEGDPEGKFAHGDIVRRDAHTGNYFVAFLAEKPEEEERMWERFRIWTEHLSEESYVVYHFAPYEAVETRALAKRYGTSAGFEQFFDRYVDLAKVVKQSVIFPTYFYSIKNLAKSRFLNYRWRHEKAGGAQSIFWYESWLETRDRSVLNDIVNYNEDDVIATKALCDWLRREGGVRR